VTRSSRPAVAVTGIGAVSAWGWGVEPLWAGLSSGATAIAGFDRFDHGGYPTHLAAQVSDAGATDEATPRGPRGACLAECFALAAAHEALRMAGFGDDLSGERAGVYFSSSTGGMFEAEQYYLALRAGERPDLRLVATHTVTVPGDAVARRFRVAGPVETTSSACASGALALESALAAVRRGDVEVALAGGSDSLCRTTFGGFNALRSVAETPCLPFRQERTGLSLGEGAGVLVLEAVDAARARGRQPLAILAGAGSASDAHHMTAPHPRGDGAARAVDAALGDAGIDASGIDFVNAHGTGTPLNDLAEWQALSRVFGRRASRLPLTSTKASIGHLLGSAGSIEAVATVLCLRHRAVHPCAGAGEIDPLTPVDLVRHQPRRLGRSCRALSLNLGFGGCNGALVLAAADRES
jgi:3-oxoacyl-[acyl-carrier-protein] synthase II